MGNNLLAVNKQKKKKQDYWRAKLRLEKHIQHISIANLELPLGTNRRHDWAKIVKIYFLKKVKIMILL